MNMKQLKYVLVLEREGSFSKAAEVLNISQPSLSQYIKKIEKQIGLPLFERTGSNVRLTNAGQVYVEAGRKILDLEHQMEAQLLDLSDSKTGSLIIGAAPFRSAGIIPAVAKQFQAIYPRIHLVIEERTNNELIEGTLRGEFDLCITILPVDERVFAFEKIMEEELILAVPNEYQNLATEFIDNRKYPAIDAKQIDGNKFVMITETQLMQKTLDDLTQDFELNLERAAVVKAIESQIAMVRAGVGMALVPTGIERFCGENDVKFYSFKQNLPRREIVAIWRKDKKLSNVAKTMLKLLKRL